MKPCGGLDGSEDIRFHQLKYGLVLQMEIHLWIQPNGGTIEFTGSVPSGESMEVYFKFEANPSNTEPSFQAEGVLISGAEPTNYSVSFGSQEEIHLITYYILGKEIC